MDTIDPADAAGTALFKKASAELARGIWKPDVAEIEAALAAASGAAVKARLANLLTHYHFSTGEMQAALDSCRLWLKFGPDERMAKDSLVSILSRLARFEEAAAEAGSRLAAEPDNHKLRSALAKALSRLGRLEEAVAYGNECLAIQDKAASVPAALMTGQKVLPFDPAARARNIIAFSLYGADPKYVDGAIRNVRAALHIYPEWTCRIYHDDSVPRAAIEQLGREGAQVLTVSGLPAARFGTFWRFLVSDDPEVDRFLVRDCDACVSLRERAAVEDWLVSGRHFHVMRDGHTHTDLVLAGMWGAVQGTLPPLGPAIVDYCKTAPAGRTADQRFLCERVWPFIRQSVLMHDSCFALPGSIDFPERANLPGPRVGQAVTWPAVR